MKKFTLLLIGLAATVYGCGDRATSNAKANRPSDSTTAVPNAQPAQSAAFVADGKTRVTVIGEVANDEGEYGLRLSKPISISGDAECGVKAQQFVGLWDDPQKIASFSGQTVAATGQLDCPRGGYVLRSIQLSPVGSASPTQAASAPNNNGALVGGWRCQDAEYAYFNDGTFVIHVRLPEGNEVLVGGSYSIDGQQFVRREKASRLLSAPPGAIVTSSDFFQWSVAAKGAKVFESNYRTWTFKILSLSDGQVVFQPVRLENWNGQDSADIRDWKPQTCNRDNLIGSRLEPIRGGIPANLL